MPDASGAVRSPGEGSAFPLAAVPPQAEVAVYLYHASTPRGPVRLAHRVMRNERWPGPVSSAVFLRNVKRVAVVAAKRYK